MNIGASRQSMPHRTHPGHHLKSLSLRQLRCFAAVARLGSFSAAARELAVSQPALSAMIRQIEEKFGLALFHRTTHKVTLSDDGRTVLPLAERLLHTADNAFEDMRMALKHQRFAVRIGVIPSALPMVADALADVAAADDGVDLHLADGRNDELVAGLGLGRFDLIIGIGPAPTDVFEAHNIMEDEMLLVAPAGHPLARAERQPWRALAGQDIVHFKGGSIGALASAALTAHGLKATERFRFDHVASLYAVVSKGLSLGLLPRLYADTLPENPRVRLIALTEPVVTRQIALIHHRQLASEHPHAQAVAEALLRVTAGRRAAHGLSVAPGYAE